ncbi:hypothetical protein D3C73_1030030 [compost metagenome]
MAFTQPTPLTQAPRQQAAEHSQQGEHAEPHTGQEHEVARHTHRRSRRGLVHQLADFIRRPIRPQAPGVDQVFVEVEFVLHVIDAGTDGAQQPTLNQRLWFSRFLGSRGHTRQRSGLQRVAAQTQQRPQ